MQKSSPLWQLACVLVLGTLATRLEVDKVQSPLRAALVLAFLLVAPPVAISGLLRGFDPLARVVLAVSCGLVLLTLTAVIMVAGGFWSPTGGLVAVEILTALCLVAQWPPVARIPGAAAHSLRRYFHRQPSAMNTAAESDAGR